jgi:hypothetical protein
VVAVVVVVVVVVLTSIVVLVVAAALDFWTFRPSSLTTLTLVYIYGGASALVTSLTTSVGLSGSAGATLFANMVLNSSMPAMGCGKGPNVNGRKVGAGPCHASGCPWLSKSVFGGEGAVC